MQPVAGQSSCVQCPLGTAISADGQLACRSCDSGYFANASGMTSCLQCAEGTIGVKQGSLGPSQCTPCNPGEFNPSKGQGVCIVSSWILWLGHFSVLIAFYFYWLCRCVSSASVVPPLRYRGKANAVSFPKHTCFACDAPDLTLPFATAKCVRGTFSGQGQTRCTNCSVGKFAFNEGEVQCQDCQSGRFASLPGSPACTICPAGSFQNTVRCECAKLVRCVADTL